MFIGFESTIRVEGDIPRQLSRAPQEPLESDPRVLLVCVSPDMRATCIHSNLVRSIFGKTATKNVECKKSFEALAFLFVS